MRYVAFFVWVLGLVACERPAAKPTTPEATYRVFAEALRGRDPKTAWQLLSTPTKDAATARAKAAAAATGGLVKDDPMIMVLQSGVLPDLNVGELTLLKKDESNAVVEVGSAGHRQEVKMVKETAGWAVDLTDVFAVRRGPGAAPDDAGTGADAGVTP